MNYYWLVDRASEKRTQLQLKAKKKETTNENSRNEESICFSILNPTQLMTSVGFTRTHTHGKSHKGPGPGLGVLESSRTSN